MPKVPIVDNQVGIKTVSNAPVQLGQLGQSLMAKDVNAANEKLNDSLMNASKVAGDYFIREEKIKNEKALSDLDFKTREEFNKVLTDSSVKDGKPVGLLNRNLGNAKGVTTEFQQKSEDIVNNLSSNLDPHLKERYLDSVRNYKQTLFEKVNSHEADQKDKNETMIFKSNLESASNAAALYDDPMKLREDVSKMQARNNEFLAAKGYSKEAIDLENKNIADKFIENNVKANLETNPNRALASLSQHKDLMNEDTYSKLKQTIDGKVFENTRSDLFNNVFSKMKLSDGNIDLARVEKNIKESKFTEEQKVKLYDFAQARAGELRQQKNQKESALDNAFHNDLATQVKNGVGLEQSLKLAGKYGHDAYDISQKEDAVRKMYDRPIKTDPEVYMSLWEKTKDGIVTKEEIDKAKTNGKISVSDWEGLRKDYYTQQLTGEGDRGFDRIKLLAEENFKSSEKLSKDKYLYEMKQATKGMNEQEKIAYAKDALKEIVTGKQFFGKFFDKKEAKYSVDFQVRDANNAAWGMISNDIGKEGLEGIKKTMYQKGSKSIGVEDMDNFAKQLGGYDKLKKGTPENNAILSLTKKKERVSVENINAVLKKYPNGIWN